MCSSQYSRPTARMLVRIFFPNPVRMSSSARPRGTAMMVMTFDRTGLERAAAAASAALARPSVPLTAHEIP